MYDDDDIKWLERKGFTDAAENVGLANRISALSSHSRFEEARVLLEGITISSIRSDLEQAIEFDRTCRCIQE